MEDDIPPDLPPDIPPDRPAIIQTILPRELSKIRPLPTKPIGLQDVKKLGFYAEAKARARLCGLRQLTAPSCIDGFSSDKVTACHLLLDNWTVCTAQYVESAARVHTSIDIEDLLLERWLIDYFYQRGIEEDMRSMRIVNDQLRYPYDDIDTEADEADEDDDKDYAKDIETIKDYMGLNSPSKGDEA